MKMIGMKKSSNGKEILKIISFSDDTSILLNISKVCLKYGLIMSREELKNVWRILGIYFLVILGLEL